MCGIHSSRAEQLGFDLRGEDRIVRSFHGSNLIGRRHAQVENERPSWMFPGLTAEKRRLPGAMNGCPVVLLGSIV